MSIKLNSKALPEYSSEIEGYRSVQLCDCCDVCIYVRHDYDNVQECMHPDYLSPMVDRHSICPKFVRSINGATFSKGDCTNEHKVYVAFYVKYGFVGPIARGLVSLNEYLVGDYSNLELPALRG